MENDDFDKRFVFSWKGGNLDFVYEEKNKKIKKKFLLVEDEDIEEENDYEFLKPNWFDDSKHNVILNSENFDAPTVQIKIPESLNSVMEAEVTQVNETINNKSEKPQLIVDLQNSNLSNAESNNFVVVKTPPLNSDVVVAMNDQSKELLVKSGIETDVLLQEATKLTGNYPEIPATSFQDNKKEIPQIIQMSLEGNKVNINNIMENIPSDVSLIRVNTPEGKPNIIAAIDKKTKEEFEKRNLNPAEELSKFIQKSDVNVVL